ncbi:hypothetical protein ACFL2H_00340 [Planctomycetota bacterium]
MSSALGKRRSSPVIAVSEFVRVAKQLNSNVTSCVDGSCGCSSGMWFKSWRSSWRVGVANLVGTCLPITPIFVLPYKRYASWSLLPLARAYLDNDRTSYESCVRNSRGMVRGYVTPPGETRIDERALHRSTLWRFVSFLGLQTLALQYGLELWQEHEPTSSLHRFEGAVAPHKHRSDQRGVLLRTARRLLVLIDRWDRTFAEKFFPRFATRARVP